MRFVRLRALSLAAVTMTCILAYVSSTGATFGTVPQATTGRVERAAANFFREVGDLVSPAQRSHITSAMRRSVRNAFSVPPSMVRAVEGRCVDVDPIDDAVFWAYQRAHVCELPVIQDYAAYTSSLDQLDVDALASAQAPQEILRRASPRIDTVPRAWDPPLTQLQMECRYRQVSATSEWQLTVRIHDRCADPVLVQRVRGLEGHLVPVPDARPGYTVAATFSFAPSLSWRIEDFVMRPPKYCATTLTAGVSSSGQFVLATQTDLHIVRPASTLGYTAPFAPPSTDAIAVGPCGAEPSSAPVTISFYRIRMR